ncbi:MAG TPA: LytTR family DNA-binding domain-containing protein [Gaiellaceae bacterium]|nr:LytTR family DNA-binding domain-containing protein [Gaiellaceae bacterium]
MIAATIVDDEAPARSELRYLLSQHPDVEVVGEAGSAADADGLLRAGGYDVVFLDVELPDLTGLELAPLARAAVVFVTAHERYAVDAFAVEAFDYLLKPVDPERLARVLERVRERVAGEQPAAVAKVAVVASGGTELVDFDQIHYVHAEGDYSRVHTYDRSYLSTTSLGDLSRKLGPGFARVHRSYLVNLAKVSGVRRVAPDRLQLQLDDAARTELDVARRQARELRGRLGL